MWGWILAGAAAIVALEKAWGIIHRKMHPEADLRELMDRLKAVVEKDDRNIQKLEHRLTEIERFQSVLCNAVLAQLNHELSGNDVERLRGSRDELQRFLSDK